MSSYYAPESMSGRVTVKSDVFSLGVVTWELFTLVSPVIAPRLTTTNFMSIPCTVDLLACMHGMRMVCPPLLTRVAPSFHHNPQQRPRVADYTKAVLSSLQSFNTP